MTTSVHVARLERVPDRELFRRWREESDEEARSHLVERWLPLARKVARRYDRQAVPLEDLVQVASLGLVKAIDRFEPGRGVGFSSYAVPTIAGELKRYFRDHCWALHMPRTLQDRAATVEHATRRLSTELGRSPSIAAVAAATALDVEQVVEAVEAGAARDAVSLDAPTRGEDGAVSGLEQMGRDDDGYRLVETAVTMAPIIAQLSRRERLVLSLRLCEDLTQSQIGERIGVSQMHVSRILRRALTRLRSAAGTTIPP